MTRTVFFASLFALMVFQSNPMLADEPAPNVLFIAVDDLRPELGCYGKEHIHSPNIDRLASSGTVFERAYCMVPTCGASRASLMSGLRPTPTRFVTFAANAEEEAPGIATLNTHFMKQGYHTISNGKVFHVPSDSASGWSEKAWRPKDYGHGYVLEENRKLADNPNGTYGPPLEFDDAEDDRYADAQIADKSIKDLQRLKEQDKPFFLAVGFLKPHLPFIAPKKYLDMYDKETIQLPKNYFPPQDVPQGAIHRWGELRKYAGVPKKGPLSDQMALDLIRGYYACVSFADAQIGRVLDELDRLELSDNTIVVLWGDHGWNLGEHTLWCKHSCFEVSMHAPLIVRAPGVGQKGQRIKALTEFIDIYPTLCELANLPQPDHLVGESFVPLLKQPTLAGKSAAVGRFKNGDTIRTDQFRFTQYSAVNKNRPKRHMLYDHQKDPEENQNIADQPEQENTVKSLRKQMERVSGR
jgi:choline-sulfatase